MQRSFICLVNLQSELGRMGGSSLLHMTSAWAGQLEAGDPPLNGALTWLARWFLLLTGSSGLGVLLEGWGGGPWFLLT